MLYTRKGDDGTTRSFSSKNKERIKKSSCQTESLGSLDELNSFLGLVKVKAFCFTESVCGKPLDEVVAWIQNGLFIIQAEVAGADKKISSDKVEQMEKWVDEIERELPPIKHFFVPGGTELASLMDVSRTLTRKVERRIVEAVEKGEIAVGKDTLAYLNRLSSLFYALARLINHKSGIKETSPEY